MKIPEQVTRLLIIFIILIAVFLVVRSQFVPEDFGELGHYRTSAVTEIIEQRVHFKVLLIVLI